MSDDQMPAWATAMEDRLIRCLDERLTRLAEQHKRTEGQLTAGIDGIEHRLIGRIAKAITDSEARLTRRLDEIRDDISVNMARADLAHTEIDIDRFGPPPTPMKPAERAQHVASVYQALAESFATVPSEAARAERESKRWLDYSISLATEKPGEAG